MEWLNLHSSVLDSPEVVGEDPTNRATWLFLLRYCIGQENAGRIASARSWGDRKWQQLIRITKREVLRDSSLWQWDGDDLLVFAYPVERESLVKNKRDLARKNGRSGGRPKNNPDETQTKPTSEPILVIYEKAEGEREREGEYNTSAPAKPARKRDPLFEALAVADGSNPTQLTQPGAKRIGVALAQIRKAMPDVTPHEIARRSRIYASVMPSGTRCTAPALAANWAKCGGVAIGTLNFGQMAGNQKESPAAPPNWRERLEREYPDNAVNRESRPWAALDPEIRAKVFPELFNPSNQPQLIESHATA